MYCMNCGRKIKNTALFCPYCGIKIYPDSTDKGRAERHGLLVFLPILFLILLVAGAGLYLKSPFGAALFGNKAKEEVREEFEAYYQPVDNDKVEYSHGEKYVSSHLLITSTQEASFDEVKELINGIDGEIVGYISISNDYQVEFPDGKDYDELQELIAALEENFCIETVSLETVWENETDSLDYTTDPWISREFPDNSGSTWTTVPDGANWWAEMIMMPEVWKMDQEYESVNVGMIDTFFDTANEDLSGAFAEDGIIGQDGLNITEMYLAAVEAEENQRGTDISSSTIAHGSVCAGIIAARNNGFGIAGISQNAVLYGVSLYGNDEKWNVSLMSYKYAIATLLNKNVRVISISMGSSQEYTFAVQQGATGADERTKVFYDRWKKNCAYMESFLEKCLKQYDFLIINSAGNSSGTTYAKVNISEEYPFGYKIADGEDEKSTLITADCDAMYSGCFAGIEDENVRKHILVVASVDMNIFEPDDTDDPYTDTVPVQFVAEAREFPVSFFSNRGKGVDIYAPGGYVQKDGVLTNIRILSDFPDNITDYMQGTSQACPMVTGVSALIWGIDPDLSSEEVRDMILSSADLRDTSSDIYTVNAYKAVKMAQESESKEEHELVESSALTGYAYYTYVNDEGEDMWDYLDADWVLYNEDRTEIIDDLPLEGGSFFSLLEAGTYCLSVACDGYEKCEETIVLDKNQTCFLALEMMPERRNLQDILLEQLGDVNIVDFCEEDFDFDGNTEAFAVVGTMDEEGSAYGNLYFVTQKGIESVIDNEGFWIYDESAHLLDFSDACFYAVGKYFTTGDLTYVFGVSEGKWYEAAVSLRGMGLTQISDSNELRIIQSAYDYCRDGTGHTWKPYYLYWDGGFHEYGGITISVSDFLLCDGGREIYDQIAAKGYSVTDIIYRSNDIININYTDGDSNQNATALLVDTKVTLLSNNDYGSDALERSDCGGIYETAFIPDIAVYPAAFPLSGTGGAEAGDPKIGIE